MNLTSKLLLAVFVLMAAATAVLWASRWSGFGVAGVTLQGDVLHSNEVTVRANLLPHLGGSLLTLDLDQTRAQFEAMPWVRRAQVRRVFPNRLRVQLQEHRAAAYWGAEDESRLVNHLGEVFEANVGEVEMEGLPRLAGPDDQSALVLATFDALQPMFAHLDMNIEQLILSVRGGWRVVLDNGAAVELGTGNSRELQDRVQRFVQTLTQTAQRHQRRVDALESADLRYSHGYALRLQGVSTVAPSPQKTPVHPGLSR
jgi:cell division protein FtsQ